MLDIIEEARAKIAAVELLGIAKSEYLSDMEGLLNKYAGSHLTTHNQYARKYAKFCIEGINAMVYNNVR